MPKLQLSPDVERKRDALKTSVADMITSALSERNLTQVQAAAVLGTDQGTVSRITCGKVEMFTLDRLVGYLLILGRDLILHSGATKFNSIETQ